MLLQIKYIYLLLLALALPQASSLRSSKGFLQRNRLEMRADISLQNFNKQLKTLARTIPVALGALAILSADPIDAMAASSGSRSGGSSFRSSSRSSYRPPSARPSSRLNSYNSYSTPLVTPIMPISPFYFPTPFFGGWGYGLGLGGGGGFSFLFNTLVFFALASTILNLVQRTGGRSFGGQGEEVEGVSVVKLQVRERVVQI